MMCRGKYGRTGYLLISLFLIGLFPISGQAFDIDPDLEERIKSDETTGYVICFQQQALLRQAPRGGWKEQRDFIMKSLRETADRSQKRVRNYLFERKIPHRTLWKENIIVVDRSDKDTFEGLKAFPEIRAIRAKPEIAEQPGDGREPWEGDTSPSESKSDDDKDDKGQPAAGIDTEGKRGEP